MEAKRRIVRVLGEFVLIVLGVMVALTGDIGRAYYLARTSIDCLALMETPPGAEAPDGGSSSLRQWRRRE